MNPLAITLLLISAVAFVQYDGTNKWFFSSAPKEALELLKPRKKELFYGAKAMGWALMIISILMILGVSVIAVWDGFRCGFSFLHFFLRYVLILTIYVLVHKRGPVGGIFFYPQAMIDRVKALGMINDEEFRNRKRFAYILSIGRTGGGGTEHAVLTENETFGGYGLCTATMRKTKRSSKKA